MKLLPFSLIIIVLTSVVYSQNKDAYGTVDKEKSGGLFDPSRLSVRNSISFGAMSNSGVSGLKSQSLYTTMMQYQFVAPVTLNLNFSLPIHSTFAPMHNLTASNLQTLDYFKSMPFEVSLDWQPFKNTFLRFTISKSAWGNQMHYNDMFYQPWEPLSRPNTRPLRDQTKDQ